MFRPFERIHVHSNARQVYKDAIAEMNNLIEVYEEAEKLYGPVIVCIVIDYYFFFGELYVVNREEGYLINLTHFPENLNIYQKSLFC